MNSTSTSTTSTFNQLNTGFGNGRNSISGLSNSNSPASDGISSLNSTSATTSSTLMINETTLNHPHQEMLEGRNIQFKNYTVTNPPVYQQNVDFQTTIQPPTSTGLQKVSNPMYPTPNHTPVSSDVPLQHTENSPLTSLSDSHHSENIDYSESESPRSKVTRETSIDTPFESSTMSHSSKVSKSNLIKSTAPVSSTTSGSNGFTKVMSDMFPPNAPRDANGYPILSRDFVVRRISEGETGRLKEDIKCEACGKGYKHITSLAKHLWEHTAEWQSTKKLLISKHQQAQLLEAASILCSFTEKESQPHTHIESHTTDTKDLKMYPLKQTIRRKSESTKSGKFGGKRRSTSFGLQSSTNMLRRDSGSAHPPIDLRRPSMHSLRPSISISASRRGSLLGSLIKEESDNQSSMVLYDSEDDDE
ncbi:hypothetical protein CANINC_003501 [Pichia inconspicua]|uniref:C2H2-type domain-containing protein n=1 Tax=Pichia inconspicua TaxID=52247 RepID=A0A4T0WYT6_9ASCO|nr:hypothetical protein CANINC_003501 [[Candida] inconspicua]